MALNTTIQKRRVTFDLPDSDSEDSDSDEKDSSLILLRKQFYYSKRRSRTPQRSKREPLPPEADIKLRSILKNPNYTPVQEPLVSSSFLPLHVINAVINSNRLGTPFLDHAHSESKEENNRECHHSSEFAKEKLSEAADENSEPLDRRSESDHLASEELENGSESESTNSSGFKPYSNKGSAQSSSDFWSIIETDSPGPVKAGSFDSDAEEFTEESLNRRTGNKLSSVKRSDNHLQQVSQRTKSLKSKFENNSNSGSSESSTTNTVTNNKPLKKVLARLSNSEVFNSVPELKPLIKTNNSLLSKNVENKLRDKLGPIRKRLGDKNNNLESVVYKVCLGDKKLENKCDNTSKVAKANSDKVCENFPVKTDSNKNSDNTFKDIKTSYSDNLTKATKTNNSDLQNFEENIDSRTSTNLVACSDLDPKENQGYFDFWSIIESDSTAPSKTGNFDSDAEECQEEQVLANIYKTQFRDALKPTSETEPSSNLALESNKDNNFSGDLTQPDSSISLSSCSASEPANSSDQSGLKEDSPYTSQKSLTSEFSSQVIVQLLEKGKVSEDSESNLSDSESSSKASSFESEDSDSTTETPLKRKSKSLNSSDKYKNSVDDPANFLKHNLRKKHYLKSKKNPNKEVTETENIKLVKEKAFTVEKVSNDNQINPTLEISDETTKSESIYDFWGIIQSDYEAPVKAGNFDSDAEDFVDKEPTSKTKPTSNKPALSDSSEESDSQEDTQEESYEDSQEDSEESYSKVEKKDFQLNTSIINNKKKLLKKTNFFTKDSENKRKDLNLSKKKPLEKSANSLDATSTSDSPQNELKLRIELVKASEINLLNFLYFENLETNSDYHPENFSGASLEEFTEALLLSYSPPVILSSSEEHHIKSDETFVDSSNSLDENQNIKNSYFKDLIEQEKTPLERLIESDNYLKEDLIKEAPEELPSEPSTPIYEDLIAEFRVETLLKQRKTSRSGRHSRQRSKSACRANSNTSNSDYPETAVTCKPNLLYSFNLATFGNRLYTELPNLPQSPTKRVIRPYVRKTQTKRDPSPPSPTMGSENEFGLNCAGEPETLSPSKRDDIKERDILIWIYNMIDEPARVDYEFFLKDGCILCKLINRVKPGSIPEEEITWEGTRSKQKNIANFLQQAEKYGVQKAKLFFPEDLLHLRHIPRVTRCLFALAKIAQDDPALGPDCPRIGDEPNFVDAAKKILIPGHRDTKEVLNQLTSSVEKKDEKKAIKHSLYK